MQFILGSLDLTPFIEFQPILLFNFDRQYYVKPIPKKYVKQVN
jgi:hypothetical protein